MNYESDVIDKKCREFAAKELLSKRDIVRSRRHFTLEEARALKDKEPDYDKTPLTKEKFMEYMTIRCISKFVDRVDLEHNDLPDLTNEILYSTDERLFFKDAFISVMLENNEPVSAYVFQYVDKERDIMLQIPTDDNLEEV